MSTMYNHSPASCRAAETPTSACKGAAGHSNLGKTRNINGAKKTDMQRKLPRSCPSPDHQVSSPEESSTCRGLQEEIFQNNWYHRLGKENRHFLSEITSSGSFLHPAPGKTASSFQKIFLDHFGNPSANI